MPVSYILAWPIGTQAGNAAFLNSQVNAQLQKILNSWAAFLLSSSSRSTLTDDKDGWFGEDAMSAMPSFDEDFTCDPETLYHRFSSWDDFFTRHYREGVRPVGFATDDLILVNACEVAPFRVAYHVQANDKFWFKDEPFSLTHMLANNEYAPQFEGGIVYEGSLGTIAYHRWHSPVFGVVRKAYLVPGAYYAENLVQGFDTTGPDESLAYIAQVNTRAVIFIVADSPSIRLLCSLVGGMCEFSSCEITVKEGQRVGKGEQLGMFQCGVGAWGRVRTVFC